MNPSYYILFALYCLILFIDPSIASCYRAASPVRCGHYICLSSEVRCDGHNDCGNNRDELDCG